MATQVQNNIMTSQFLKSIFCSIEPPIFFKDKSFFCFLKVLFLLSLSFGANFWPWWRQRWQRLKWRRRRQRWRRQQWRRRRQQQEKFRQQNDNQFSTQMAFFMRGTNSQDMPSKQGIAVGWLSSTNSYFVFLDEHGRNYQLLFKFHLNLACFDSQCKTLSIIS